MSFISLSDIFGWWCRLVSLAQISIFSSEKSLLFWSCRSGFLNRSLRPLGDHGAVPRGPWGSVPGSPGAQLTTDLKRAPFTWTFCIAALFKQSLEAICSVCTEGVLLPGPMRGGSSRYIVPGPDSYGGARDWRNIWVFCY